MSVNMEKNVNLHSKSVFSEFIDNTYWELGPQKENVWGKLESIEPATHTRKKKIV